MPIKHGISSNTLKIIRRLHDAGYDAYVVGGAVRDLLLDIDPKDYDLSTNATPEQVKEVFGRKAMIIGRRFRLVHVRMGPELFEVSTFRREPTEEERKGRNEDSGLLVWRDNEFGTVEQDASRRDFTVNAIFYLSDCSTAGCGNTWVVRARRPLCPYRWTPFLPPGRACRWL